MAISSGQNTYLILDSLNDGSKYGLEIIEYISKKSGGNYIMKKPSLYSSLTRMEKKGLISSSFWGESELGGKRHYYSITSTGKKEYESLKKEFENLSFESNEEKTQPELHTIEKIIEKEEKPVFLQQDNLFDMVKKDEPKQETIEEPQSDLIENQIDFFSFAQDSTQVETEETPAPILETEETISQQEETTKVEETELKDDAKFLDKSEQFELTPFQEAQNKILYDTSSELKKYRKKKSFSENQIEMAVVYEREEDKLHQKEQIEQLKQSLFNARQKGLDEISQEKTNQEDEIEFKKEIVSNNFEEEKDDAVFITSPRIHVENVPIQRKISPTNIEVNIYDDNLPAPNRDSSLEPTYKDMMAKLFERKKEKTVETKPEPQIERVDSFADYSNLKKYYASHNIEFKEYCKTSVKQNHNTNFLNLITSIILLALSGIGSGIFYAIINAANLINPTTNFMFYLFPILFVVYIIFNAIKFKLYPSKKPALAYNSVVNWAVCILATVIVFVLNIIAGMQYETIALYSTSLVIPIWNLLILLPINYYAKLIAYKKFGK